LFGKDLNHRKHTELFAGGAAIKTTKLTKEFDYEDFQSHYDGQAVPLLLIDENWNLQVSAANESLTPRPGQSIIALVPAELGTAA
jgi:hypothetical protein